MEARLAILSRIEADALVLGSHRKAREAFVARARAGLLEDTFPRLLAEAAARRGEPGGRTISLGALIRWRAEQEAGGLGALAPAPAGNPDAASWPPVFPKRWKILSKPSISAIHEALTSEGVAPHRLAPGGGLVRRPGGIGLGRGRRAAGGPRRRWNTGDPPRRSGQGLPQCDARRGRNRLASGLIPTFGTLPQSLDLRDIAASREFPPSDSFVPAIPLARLGIAKQQSPPYSSQARGVGERFHRSCWARAAKQLPAFMGADMDPEARKIVHPRGRREIAEGGRSRFVMPWDEFPRWAQDRIDAHNARPRRGLAKTTDPDGRWRRLCPDETWAAGLRDHEPARAAEADADPLFRPYFQRRVNRGVVSIGAKTYFAKALEDKKGAA